VKDWKPAPFVIYLKLTLKDMPTYLATKLHVDGKGRELGAIGADLKAAIGGAIRAAPELPYDPQQIIRP
jgi:hypothetical protein